ncbi:MAG: rod shape-determining protein, partial [Muribaculaceae bacterium]|nr:rod shape-determining protein [Muribaculaceae bacterium]
MGENNTERHIVAFEIGSSKIRGAIGAVDNSGVVDVIAIEEEKLTDKVRYGCIQNVDVSTALGHIIERLQSYPRIEPRKITGVYVALGGRTLTSRTVNVNLSLPAETEITPPIINDLCQQAKSAIGGERDVVDVVPVRFTVDNKAQATPIGSYGHSVGARMTVLSCAPQMKRMLRRVIYERLGLTINGYVPRIIAEASMALTDDERRLGCMFVDFGAETTSVAIYKNGAPLYVATLPIGSRNITLDLTALNYIEERAEEIKKVSGNAMPQEGVRRKAPGEGIDYTEINNYVHARADEIIANIMAQMEYAGVRDTDLPGGIVIVGGGARLRGFNELLAQQSKMKVRQGAPTASVRITDGTIDRTEMVDVISILVAAANMPYSECLTPMPSRAGRSAENTDNSY